MRMRIPSFMLEIPQTLRVLMCGYKISDICQNDYHPLQQKLS